MTQTTELKHGAIVEYRDTKHDDFAKQTILETGTDGRKEFKLYHMGIGFQLAGSVARWNAHEYFGVQFYMDGATHGRSFLLESEARALFVKWTAPNAE